MANFGSLDSLYMKTVKLGPKCTAYIRGEQNPYTIVCILSIYEIILPITKLGTYTTLADIITTS